MSQHGLGHDAPGVPVGGVRGRGPGRGRPLLRCRWPGDYGWLDRRSSMACTVRANARSTDHGGGSRREPSRPPPSGRTTVGPRPTAAAASARPGRRWLAGVRAPRTGGGRPDPDATDCARRVMARRSRSARSTPQGLARWVHAVDGPGARQLLIAARAAGYAPGRAQSRRPTRFVGPDTGQPPLHGCRNCARAPAAPDLSRASPSPRRARLRWLRPLRRR